MNHLVTFATDDMSKARELCVKSALAHGVDKAYPHEPPLEMEFANFRAASERGYGYWRWKPDLINRTLTYAPGVKDGDILIYADAGVEFINNVSHIIERMDQDIFLFGNNWAHAHWCKRDVIEAVWPVTQQCHCVGTETEIDHPSWHRYGKQCQASVIFFRVSDYTRQFVAEWLKWCLFEGGRLIDDSPSRLPNHPEFREHRHDQAILTTLAYREGINLHYWPAMYNDGAFNYEKVPEYAGDGYPILFHHHRRRNHEWSNAA